MFKEAVQAAYFAQEKEAIDAAIELKSLSCTLLIAFTLPLIDGKWFYRLLLDWRWSCRNFDPATKNVRLLGEVDSGLYSGETQF